MQLNIQEKEGDNNNDNNNNLPITYDDILSKMGMFVSNGKLHLSTKTQSVSPTTTNNSNNINNLNNSYIYNKYFNTNNETKQNEIRKPKSIEEYKTMVLQDYIQRQKIKQIKSTKLVIPTLNIHISNNNLSQFKLFSFH